MEKKYTTIALFGLLALFGWLAYLVLSPVLGYVIMGLVFALLFAPIYRVLDRFLWSGLAAFIVIVLTLLVIIIPSIYLGGELVGQATHAYQAIQARGLSLFDESSVAEYVYDWIGIDLSDEIIDLFRQGRTFLREALPGIIIGTGSFLLGLFLLFFVMYYALKDGASWYAGLIASLPIQKAHREHLGERLKKETSALLYGQILTSVFVALLCGAIMYAAGVENAILWGAVMVILGLIPALGAPLVYVPAGAYLLAHDQWLWGLVVLAGCAGVHFLIDYIIRPKMISEAAEIHPVIVLLGAIGGIIVLGAVGFLVGPLILSIFVTLLGFDPAKDA